MHFWLTSKDVVHGFFIPRANVNVMVLPGQIAHVEAHFATDPFFSYLAGDASERNARMRQGWRGILRYASANLAATYTTDAHDGVRHGLVLRIDDEARDRACGRPELDAEIRGVAGLADEEVQPRTAVAGGAPPDERRGRRRAHDETAIGSRGRQHLGIGVGPPERRHFDERARNGGAHLVDDDPRDGQADLELVVELGRLAAADLGALADPAAVRRHGDAPGGQRLEPDRAGRVGPAADAFDAWIRGGARQDDHDTFGRSLVVAVADAHYERACRGRGRRRGAHRFAFGVRCRGRGDRITVSMPTCPQGVIAFPADPGGVASNHCQKLFWDIPAVTQLATVAVGAPYEEDSIPRWSRGITDRPPPLWVGTLNATQQPEGFEFEADCLANATGCQAELKALPVADNVARSRGLLTILLTHTLRLNL